MISCDPVPGYGRLLPVAAKLMPEDGYWSSQDSVDTRLVALCTGFEHLRTHAAKVGMASGPIVERVDVV
jgi:hypothetical protein